MTGIRSAFEQRFGALVAQAIVRAAEEHTTGTARYGSDPFRWALVVAIGNDCLTTYRGYHGIDADPEELRAWVIEHADLAAHDGDLSSLALICDVYDGWIADTSGSGGGR